MKLLQRLPASCGAMPRIAATISFLLALVLASGPVPPSRVLAVEDPPVYLRSWGVAGTGNGELNGPQGVAVDTSGNVYVADTNNHRMQKFTSAGTYMDQWGSPGSGDGELSSPIHVDARSSGAIYVADGDNDRVQYFDADGTYLGQFGTTGDMVGDGPGEFVWTMGIATDTNGDVYVTDWGNHRVQKFDADGDYLDQWGSGLFTSPLGLATDSSDSVYLAEWGNNRVQKYDGSDWSVLIADAGLSNPSGVAVDADGNVYVCDSGNHRIRVFDSEGNLLTTWGSFGTGPGQFKQPMGIALDADGNVYVADTNNNRIQVFGEAVNVEGDANGDGATNIIDAMFIAQYTVGLRTLDATQLLCADTTDDGLVNIIDAMHVAQFSVDPTGAGGVLFKQLWETPADDALIDPLAL